MTETAASRGMRSVPGAQRGAQRPTAADLRKLAMYLHKELSTLPSDLYDLEETRQLRSELDRMRGFLQALALVPGQGRTIAITGMQGVGKSSLANALLGLPQSHPVALPTGRLRCEQVPVLVRQPYPGERVQAHYLPARFPGDPAEALVPVTHPVARDLVLGGAVENGDEPMLIDFPLPTETGAHLPPFVNLLVLPGFERGKVWSDLAMAAMLLADHAVFVMDHSALASRTGLGLLEESMARFGQDGLTVVFSKMDQANQNAHQMEESLNALGVGTFSTELGNLFHIGLGAAPGREEGLGRLRDAIFAACGPTSAPAGAARTRQLATHLRGFVEGEMEPFVKALRKRVEASLGDAAPSYRIYASISERVRTAHERASKHGGDAARDAIDRAYRNLPDDVERAIYAEASGWEAIVEKFNPWQAYDDQQFVRLDHLMRDMVDQRLGKVPVEALTVALKAFRDNLPSSMFKGDDEGDRNWAACFRLENAMNIHEAQDRLSREFLSAFRPVADAMISILDTAASAGKGLNGKAIKDAAGKVISDSSARSLRRWMAALGIMEAGDLGLEIAASGAGSATGAEGAATAAATISAPVATALAAAAVVLVAALCIKAAKGYKVQTSQQARYLVVSSREAITQSMLDGVARNLDWFREQMDLGLQLQLGLRRAEDAQYRLGVQVERISFLRAQTLRALDLT